MDLARNETDCHVGWLGFNFLSLNRNFSATEFLVFKIKLGGVSPASNLIHYWRQPHSYVCALSHSHSMPPTSLPPSFPLSLSLFLWIVTRNLMQWALYLCAQDRALSLAAAKQARDSKFQIRFWFEIKISFSKRLPNIFKTESRLRC